VRCWRRAALEFPDGLAVLIGPNGAGKTSVLEAITLACVGVSPRTSSGGELVREGAEALWVGLDIGHGGQLERREIGYAPGRPRRLRRAGEAVRSLGEWRLPGALLVFLPEQLRSVKGPPAARRRSLDRLLEAAEDGYTAALGGYQEALAQRNALLRRVRAGETGPDGLAPWEARLSELGARVAASRRRATAVLSPIFARRLDELGGTGGAAVALETSIPELATVADDRLEATLAGALRGLRGRDIAAAQTTAGPHRDDLWVGAGRRDLRRLGSQGEQRLAALALLLAGRDMLSATAPTPVMLMDDVLSELDPPRRAALLRALAVGGQALLTTADPLAAAEAERCGAVRIPIQAAA